jgi:hypothetical protein
VRGEDCIVGYGEKVVEIFEVRISKLNEQEPIFGTCSGKSIFRYASKVDRTQSIKRAAGPRKVHQDA